MHVVPPRDRSARPGARELRRHRQVAHQGQRRAGRRRPASCTTARRWTARRACATRCCSTRTSFLLSFTENLMTYALGRRVEADDMPTVRRDHPRRRRSSDYRMSAFVQGVVNSPAFRMTRPRRRATTDDGRSRPDSPDRVRLSRTVTETDVHHARSTCHRRTVLKGIGVDHRAAVPRRDGAGRHGAGAGPRAGRSCGSSPSRWCTAPPAAPRSALKKNLWAPAATGAAFDLSADQPGAARAVPRLPHHRQQHRRAQRRGVHRRRRSAAITSARARCS